MKKRIFMFMLFASMAAAQVSPPSTQSRVAGRFVAYNYGLWSLPVYTMPSGTGSQTFTLSNSTARLQDGRAIMPFAVNAPLRVGTETVTVTSVGAGCIINSTAIGACSITATFTLPHTVADRVASGTWGLQEALNDAAASGGGIVVTDSAWTSLGGTTAISNAATLGTGTSIESISFGLLPGSIPTTTFYLDGGRTDNYTPTGSQTLPFKTLDTLATGITAYVSGGGTGPITIVSNPSTYTSSSTITLPAIPTVIYGNGSTWTTAGLTITAKVISYDLIDGGPVTYNYSGTDRSEKHGGAFLSNVYLTQGYLHAFGTNLGGNSNTFTVGGASTVGLLYGEALTGSQKIASGGAGGIISLYNINMTKSSGINVDMAAGGQLLMNGGLLTTVAGTANVNLPTANSASTAHSISGLITPTGNGIMCASGTTTYLYFGPSVTAATYCTIVPTYTGPFSIPSIKSTTGTRYLCVGTTGTITSSTTACSGT
jgi:hypothetical protein